MELFKPSACKNHAESNMQNASLSIEVRKNCVDRCHQDYNFPDIENLMKQKTFTRQDFVLSLILDRMSTSRFGN